MIIKILLYILTIFLILLIISTIRYLYWNILLKSRQSKINGNIKLKLNYKLRISLMVILVVSMISIRLNATNIYLSLVGYNQNADCAYSLDDKVKILEHNTDVLIVNIDSLDEIKKFDILNQNHSILIDRHFYTFTRVSTLRGRIENTSTLMRSIPVKHPLVSVSDFCIEGTPLEVGETYLIIGGYVDESESSKNTDPRIKYMNYIYVAKAVLLEDYDASKPVEDQSIMNQNTIKEYLTIINNH